jgi:hypothetical protein
VTLDFGGVERQAGPDPRTWPGWGRSGPDPGPRGPGPDFGQSTSIYNY